MLGNRPPNVLGGLGPAPSPRLANRLADQFLGFKTVVKIDVGVDPGGSQSFIPAGPDLVLNSRRRSDHPVRQGARHHDQRRPSGSRLDPPHDYDPVLEPAQVLSAKCRPINGPSR